MLFSNTISDWFRGGFIYPPLILTKHLLLRLNLIAKFADIKGLIVMGKLTAEQKAARREKFDSFMGKASEVLSGVSGIIGGAMNNASINDTTGYEDSIDGTKGVDFNLGDYDSLMSAYNPLALNNMVTYDQVRGGSTAGRVGNTLSSTVNGALTGSTFGPWGAVVGGVAGLGAGIGGWIAGDSKAKDKVEELNALSHRASNEYLNNFSANAERIGDNMFRSKILNIAACGGFLPRKFAFGGLQPDYDNGTTLIKNGGTHESNPYEGVQVGVDPQGIPNLVEEGEVIYDDYVYSNRLKPTKKQLESISLPSKYFGKTYAEIAKDIQKRSDEMPNDPIERRGLEDGMYKLRAIQDETKQRMEQQRFMREFNKLSDDDKFALINGINQEAQQMQQQRLSEEQQMADMQSQQEEYDNQPQPNQEAGIASQMNQYGNAIEGYAYGGNMFPRGGYITYDKSISKADAKKIESGSRYKNILNIINGVANGRLKGKDKEYVDSLMRLINTDERMNDYVINDYNDLYRLASDGNVGPVHDLIMSAAENPKSPYYIKDVVFPETFDGINLKQDEMEALAEGYFDRYKKSQLYDDSDFITGLNPLPVDRLRTGNIVRRGDINTINGGLPVKGNNISVEENKGDDDGKDNGLKLNTNYPEWLRYAPLITSAGAVIGDLFGANNPDYSLWDNATKAANRINYVSPSPLGDYLAYNPYDVNYMQGRINAQNAMAQRNILNTSSGNRGAAISGILAAQQQGLNNMSDMYRQALEYNDKQRQAVADFNRGTNQTNAQMSLQAQAQNAQLDRQRVSDLIQLAAQKQNILNASQQAKAENLTNLATLAGKYGKENVNINQLNRLINNDAISIGGNKGKNGGKLKKRRR